MEFLRQWLMGIVVSAILVSASRELVREGAAAQAVRFCGGLILLLCILQPLGKAEPIDPAFALADLRQEASALTEIYRRENENENARRIARETAAYIEEQALHQGIVLTAEVEITMRDGLPIPYAVTLSGEKDQALSQLITQKLDIPPQRQKWSMG